MPRSKLFDGTISNLYSGTLSARVFSFKLDFTLFRPVAIIVANATAATFLATLFFLIRNGMVHGTQH